MKFLLAVVVALALVPSAMAKPDPQVVALRKQVAALTLQVKTLRASVVQLLTQLKSAVECSYARAYKLSAGNFNYIDAVAARLGLVPAPTVIPPYDDHGACLVVGVAYTP